MSPALQAAQLARWLIIAVAAAAIAAAAVAPVLAQEPGAQALQTLLQTLADDMREIPAGSYLMGNAEANFADADEKPTRQVTLRRFQLARHAVTFAQYDAYTDATGRARVNDEGWGRDSRPVIHVSWNDAQEFIRWLNARSGQHYRLPSEAEWEYAARAGSKGHYPWGDHFQQGLANSAGTVGAAGTAGTAGPGAASTDRHEFTAPVGSFPANGWGLFDMIGNVEQWVADCYRESYSAAPVDGSAVDDQLCAQRVRRGGSWGLAPWFLRVDYRNSAPPTLQSDAIGFRLARDD